MHRLNGVRHGHLSRGHQCHVRPSQPNARDLSRESGGEIRRDREGGRCDIRRIDLILGAELAEELFRGVKYGVPRIGVRCRCSPYTAHGSHKLPPDCCEIADPSARRAASARLRT